jgi:hypothetical protein
VANSSSVQPWALTMPIGSLQQWLFEFTTVNSITGQSVPYPIAGATWEYVVRVNATDGGSAPISFGTTPTTQGVLVVTPGSGSTASTVQLNLYPAATQSLTPQTMNAAMWANPNSGSAICWFSGPLILQATSQP